MAACWEDGGVMVNVFKSVFFKTKYDYNHYFIVCKISLAR